VNSITHTSYFIVTADEHLVWSREEQTLEDAKHALKGFRKNYPKQEFRIMEVKDTRTVLEEGDYE